MERFEPKPNEEKVSIKTMRNRLLHLFHPDHTEKSGVDVKEIIKAYGEAEKGNPETLTKIYREFYIDSDRQQENKNPVLKGSNIDIIDRPSYDKPGRSFIA